MLINCPECDKQISDKAHACPRCGFPLDESKNIGNDSKLPDNILSVKDIMNHLGISQNKAYDLVHYKGFPKIIIGHRYFIHKDKYIKWIDENVKGKIIL
jgi:predicted DNA-binding transcriptional regulator AlpA